MHLNMHGKILGRVIPNSPLDFDHAIVEGADQAIEARFASLKLVQHCLIDLRCRN